MTSLQPYKVYQTCGVRWLDRLPLDWTVSRARYLCKITTGSGDTIDAVPHGTYPFIVRSQQPLASSTYDFDCEAILTAGDGGVGEVFHHVKGKFLAHQRVYVLHDFRGIDTRFFFYYFSSHFGLMARDGSAKTTVDSVRRWMLTDMPVPVPPIDEQQAIVRYLDQEIAQIDTLIEKQKDLVERLRERRVALVDHALFGGLSVRPERQCTDALWLGRFPAHWKVRPLWTMYRRIKDVNHPDETMLSVFRDHGVVAKSSRANLNVTADNRSIYQLVHPGWLVANRMKAWQGAVGISSLRGIVSGHYICFAPLHGEDDRYLNWLFRSHRYTSAYAQISRGVRIGQAEIDNAEYRKLPVVLPPISEQHRITASLEEGTAHIDGLIQKSRRFIDLAKERRSALITAAVTGQLDVRAVA